MKILIAKETPCSSKKHCSNSFHVVNGTYNKTTYGIYFVVYTTREFYDGFMEVLLWVFSKRERITLRLLNAVAIPSVCLLSVVCDVGAPYSGG